ncbi:MAG: transcriptional repressor [Deltaproteobacteria bacterium]|nr:transcriptional repressor [Deltaproteobacteria bacterium]
MKKSRNTRQRAVILDVLKNTESSHPTAETIYREARKVLPNISLGTVYRNLNFLRGQGLVREIRSNNEASSRFEGERPPHAHFHCTCCQTVHDIPLPDCVRNLQWEGDTPICSVNSLELHIVGACSQCVAVQS